MPASCVYEGTISHRRSEPLEHGFEYPIALMYLDLDELPELFDRHRLFSARGRAPAQFRRSDYLGDPRVPLAEAVRELVRERTGTRPEGPVRLLTHLRYLGHCFNPVSFYYCFERDGQRVAAVVAEVTNTPWGERHAYVLQRDVEHPGPVLEDRLEKVFHVSPFMAMDHTYQWRVLEPGARLAVHIESSRAGRKAFDATLALERRELSRASLSRVLWRYPAATLALLSRIYWQALRLKLKGAPYVAHPAQARG